MFQIFKKSISKKKKRFGQNCAFAIKCSDLLLANISLILNAFSSILCNASYYVSTISHLAPIHPSQAPSNQTSLKKKNLVKSSLATREKTWVSFWYIYICVYKIWIWTLRGRVKGLGGRWEGREGRVTMGFWEA